MVHHQEQIFFGTLNLAEKYLLFGNQLRYLQMDKLELERKCREPELSVVNHSYMYCDQKTSLILRMLDSREEAENWNE